MNDEYNHIAVYYSRPYSMNDQYNQRAVYYIRRPCQYIKSYSCML